jgi:hypothetical protein
MGGQEGKRRGEQEGRSSSGGSWKHQTLISPPQPTFLACSAGGNRISICSTCQGIDYLAAVKLWRTAACCGAQVHEDADLERRGRRGRILGGSRWGGREWWRRQRQRTGDRGIEAHGMGTHVMGAHGIRRVRDRRTASNIGQSCGSEPSGPVTAGGAVALAQRSGSASSSCAQGRRSGACGRASIQPEMRSSERMRRRRSST